MMWLTKLKQNGYDVTIEGRCMSLTALSDFVGNLEAPRYFKRPVEILSSEVVAATQQTPRAHRVHASRARSRWPGIAAAAAATPGQAPPQEGRRTWLACR